MEVHGKRHRDLFVRKIILYKIPKLL
jgi:hypothetical protein